MHVEAAEQSVRAQSPSGSMTRISPHSKRLVYAILIAQLLSVALAVTGVSSARLTDQGINAPTTQSFLNYCLLAVVFGTVHLAVPWLRVRAVETTQGNQSSDADSSEADNSCSGRPPPEDQGPSIRQQDSSKAGSCCLLSQLGTAKQPPAADPSGHLVRLRRLWPVFAAVAFIDVEANTLVTKAYQYTSLTSVTLLDCFTIPAVMILSWLVLRSRYRVGHLLGACCCIAGLSVLVLGDSRTDPTHNDLTNSVVGDVPSCGFGSSEPCMQQAGRFMGTSSADGSKPSAGSHPLLGDVLVLLGAVLYSICNVSQELLLGDVQPSELLAYIGLFGALISGVQAAALEHQALLAVDWLQLSVAGPMLAFAAAMFCFYTLVPQVLIMGGAAVLNISLLTSDVWAALARYLWFGGFGGSSAYFFLGSLAMVAVGIVVYAASGSPKDTGSRAGSPSGSPDDGTAPGGRRPAGVLHGRPQYTRLHSAEPDVESALSQQPLGSATL
eukprot:GHUV01004724.1.p1 GENE.GHUV01004724.1~~GHUV01004724.1.p1  ORF type:complete len:497 (+),score=106.18 GHUV01004724.1:228-1718(+)